MGCEISDVGFTASLEIQHPTSQISHLGFIWGAAQPIFLTDLVTSRKIIAKQSRLQKPPGYVANGITLQSLQSPEKTGDSS